MFYTINRSFLATLLAISLIPLAILGTIIIRFERNVLLDQSIRELQAVSSAVALNLENYITELLHDTSVIATLPGIQSMDAEQQQEMLIHIYEESERFGQMAIIDLSRQVQLTARPQEQMGQIKDSNSFRRASTGTQSWTLGPWAFTPGLAIHFHTPLENQSDQIIGVMGAAVPMTVLAPFLTQFDVGENGAIFVLDRNNHVLIHPDSAELQGVTPNYDHLFLPENALNLTSNENSIGGWSSSGSAIISENGTDFLAVYTRVDSLGWTVVTMRPMAEALAATTRTVQVTLLALLIMGTLSTILAIVSARQLSRPIERLATAAVALESGYADTPLPPPANRNQEVQQLIKAFGRMRDVVIEREERLRQLSQSLEIRVHERTIALEGANKQLAAKIDQHQQTLSELRVAKELAEEANRAKSSFLGTVSHELRTPLNAIIGYAELLYEDDYVEANDGTQQDVGAIIQASRHLLHIINDILRFTQSQSEEVQVYLTKFNIGTLLQDISSTMAPLMAQRKNRFEIIYQIAVAEINSDKTKVYQILLNLLGNAAKFTENGKVVLEATQRTTVKGEIEVGFKIIDTGIGISAAKVPSIFDPFVQVSDDYARQYEGTGLGLAITKSYCDMLEGSITVQSDEGKGTAFSVWLPANLSE